MSECKHPINECESYHDNSVVCNSCNCVIEQNGKKIEPPSRLDMIAGFSVRAHDNSLRFELGKTYKHTSGNTMTIIGSLKTHIYDWTFVAELPDGTLKPVGYTDDGYAQNWSEVK